MKRHRWTDEDLQRVREVAVNQRGVPSRVPARAHASPVGSPSPHKPPYKGGLMIEFFVKGIPQTKGSARAFLPKKGGRYPVVTNDNPKNKKWARSVKIAAQNAMKRDESGLLVGPIKLYCTFFTPQPKRVKSGLELSTTRPDLDKMVRSVGDALEGVCYKQDAQIAGIVATKFYSLKPGVQVTVESMLITTEGVQPRRGEDAKKD